VGKLQPSGLTKIRMAERWLHYALADGPIPAKAGRQAWLANGLPPGEAVLHLAKPRAGVTSERHGGTHGRWWWRATGDTRTVPNTLTTLQCDTCHRVLELPAPRHCISTPRCHGWYRPTQNSPATSTALPPTTA
jgi:hypothetical protein